MRHAIELLEREIYEAWDNRATAEDPAMRGDFRDSAARIRSFIAALRVLRNVARVLGRANCERCHGFGVVRTDGSTRPTLMGNPCPECSA